MSTADTTSLASLKERPGPAGGLGQSRRHGLLSLACCLGIALIGGCSEQRATSYPLLPVKVQPVKLVNYTPKVTLTGEIAARVQSDLSFRVGGRIIERKVEVGDACRVRGGAGAAGP